MLVEHICFTNTILIKYVNDKTVLLRRRLELVQELNVVKDIWIIYLLELFSIKNPSMQCIIKVTMRKEKKIVTCMFWCCPAICSCRKDVSPSITGDVKTQDSASRRINIWTNTLDTMLLLLPPLLLLLLEVYIVRLRDALHID